MRSAAPSVYLPRAIHETYLPNLAKLANEGVDFTNHHIASSACVASRATMVTGLYTHQTAMFGGGIGPDLNPGFPTYGTMLRSLGYDTFWFGKWHLSFAKDRCPRDPYEAYGFTTLPGPGTCPDPVGGPYEGLLGDPVISQKFVDWLAGRPRNGASPWCATVSFVNPHDVALYPNYTKDLEAKAPHLFDSLPANFETARDRSDERKPALHQQLADVVNLMFGELPDSGVPTEPWIRLLDTYVLTQQLVDAEIGHVLRALERSPFAQNTVVIFTSDHGDYTGSHGLRGKCYGMYEEGILVPLIVKDPTGTWTAGRNTTRSQLSSHVDLVPLLLTLATGSEGSREEPQYEHLSTRLSSRKSWRIPTRQGGRTPPTPRTSRRSSTRSGPWFQGAVRCSSRCRITSWAYACPAANSRSTPTGSRARPTRSAGAWSSRAMTTGPGLGGWNSTTHTDQPAGRPGGDRERPADARSHDHKRTRGATALLPASGAGAGAQGLVQSIQGNRPHQCKRGLSRPLDRCMLSAVVAGQDLAGSLAKTVERCRAFQQISSPAVRYRRIRAQPNSASVC